MPLTLDLSHRLVYELAAIRREGKQMTYNRKGKEVTYLRPDAKSQVTIEYDDVTHKPLRIDTIVVSTQHDEFLAPVADTEAARLKADEDMLQVIRKDVAEVLIPRVKAQLSADVAKLFDCDYKLYVNPTGKFVIGGPHGDTGLTGRKIIVDTYGGRGAHGGGAFSGKDPSKVDRSAAYAARHIAKNLVKAGVADEVLVQLAYAIGKAEPVSIFINTYGRGHVAQSDSEIAKIVAEKFDLTPAGIISRFNLKQPIYLETASYGHMGRQPRVVTKTFGSRYDETKTVTVKLFPWEETDMVETLRPCFTFIH
jgi:S-adenosylmethionine synthetase